MQSVEWYEQCNGTKEKFLCHSLIPSNDSMFSTFDNLRSNVVNVGLGRHVFGREVNLQNGQVPIKDIVVVVYETMCTNVVQLLC